MRTWRKAVSIENSDTGIVCFYIQDTFEIAKFPWTTKNNTKKREIKDNIVNKSCHLLHSIKDSRNEIEYMKGLAGKASR